MSFHDNMVRLYEENLIADLERRIQEKLGDVQQVLDDGEGIELHKAQGEKRALKWLFGLPDDILSDAEAEAKQ